MCGIVGIVGEDASRHQHLAVAMSERIAHRGPDGQGLWTEGDATLAHRRLAIIDLSPAGAQPMVSECGQFVVVFNGEIYNYLELREELSGSEQRFRTSSDTEVLLAAWRRWRHRSLTRLNGMFAFAIWDRKERSLFAARDRFGEKPFYYFQHGSTLYFASEVKAFKAIPWMVWRPDVQAIADFAVERVTDHSATCLFDGIRQLRPGSWLRFTDGHMSHGTYWSLDSVTTSSSIGDEELRSLIRDAVRIRLRADTPVGTLLSGGVDSSVVTCIMADFGLPQAKYTYSTINSPPVSEAVGIDAVLRQFPGLQARQDHPTASQFWRDLPLLLWHQEEPFGDASMAAHFSLMRLARQTGVPVLLTGQGADEVFGGYESSLYHHLGSRLRQWPPQAAWNTVRRMLLSPEIPFRNVLFHALPLSISRPLKKRLVHYPDWLSPDFRRVSTCLDSVETEQEDPSITYMKNLLRVRTLPGFLHYEDRNSMAFGVETRLPFLDHRLAEAMVRMPSVRTYEGGWTKARLRAVSGGLVPSTILLRKVKMGYPAPLAGWIRDNRTAFEERTDDRSFRECPIIEQRAWRRRVKAFFNGDTQQVHAVWRGFLLATWHSDILLGDGRRPSV
jgi:asparagine synthase (glutamine-hydrolysing)